MLTLPLEDLLPVASKAVDLARTILHDAPGYGRLTPKGERDYASDLDFQIERQLRDHLRASDAPYRIFWRRGGPGRRR